MNSAGHRANILNDGFREVGIGIEMGGFKSYEAAMVTQNFARSGSGAFLTGVAYADQDGDRFYDPGEGLGGIAVTLSGAKGGSFSTVTTASGGYQIQLPADTYTVTFSGEGVARTSKQVSIGSRNVDLDLVDPQTDASQPLATQPEPASLPPPDAGLVSGTAGNDTLAGTAADDRLAGLGGGDRLGGRTGNDVLNGGGGSDRLLGEDGHDRLLSGTGNDNLSGAAGNDTLSGGSGKDTLLGGAGDDLLSGGSEADLFQFRSAWRNDRIEDFQNGVDLLDLRNCTLNFSALKIARADLDSDGTDDLLIQAGGQSVGLLNTAASSIDVGDFLF